METFRLMWQLYSSNPVVFWEAVARHVELVLVPMAAAILLAVPLGVFVARVRWLAPPVIGLASILQTIPALALLALLIVLGFGIGKVPAEIALFLYALLPILRNTYTGIVGVDSSIKKAARGVGMTELQVLLRVELPLASGVIWAGIRTTMVIIVGTAPLAALIGGGGLGQFITQGMATVRNEFILLGAIPATLMALLADAVMGRVETWLTPRGLKL